MYILARDFDRDGDPDLVIGGSDVEALAVDPLNYKLNYWENVYPKNEDQDLPFENSQNIDSFSLTEDIVSLTMGDVRMISAADINQDGNLDLAYSDGHDVWMSVWNRSTGQFDNYEPLLSELGVLEPVGYLEAVGIGLADVTENGGPDLIFKDVADAATSETPLSIYFHEPRLRYYKPYTEGGFDVIPYQHSSSNEPYNAYYALDLDRDGDLDIVNAKGARVWLNQ